MFKFKQFSVDQSGCAMKINTDGVLLGAVAGAANATLILDIGTGTGVIGLMLAQRFMGAQINAVEIDTEAAKTAERNFAGSAFADRLRVYAISFEGYFEQFPDRKYDLIVSNPPFYIDSLKSPGVRKTLAKHTDMDFFERLMKGVSDHLAPDGCFWLIIPVALADAIISLSVNKCLFPAKLIYVQSYPDSAPHRVVICLGFEKKSAEITNLTIYKAEQLYSDEYKTLLQPYFIDF